MRHAEREIHKVTKLMVERNAVEGLVDVKARQPHEDQQRIKPLGIKPRNRGLYECPRVRRFEVKVLSIRQRGCDENSLV